MALSLIDFYCPLPPPPNHHHHHHHHHQSTASPPVPRTRPVPLGRTKPLASNDNSNSVLLPPSRGPQAPIPSLRLPGSANSLSLSLSPSAQLLPEATIARRRPGVLGQTTPDASASSLIVITRSEHSSGASPVSTPTSGSGGSPVGAGCNDAAGKSGAVGGLEPGHCSSSWPSGHGRMSVHQGQPALVRGDLSAGQPAQATAQPLSSGPVLAGPPSSTCSALPSAPTALVQEVYRGECLRPPPSDPSRATGVEVSGQAVVCVHAD
jgi:hypothetical protein